MMKQTNDAIKQKTDSGVASVVSGGVSSSVRPGDLPIHVLEDDGPRVVEGSSTVNPRGWTTVRPY